MIRKAIFIFPFLLLMTIGLLAQLPDTSVQLLSLQQCIELALKNNADVQHRGVTSETAKANWQGAKGNMISTLNGDISHGMNQGRSIDPFTNTYANQNIGFANYSLNSSVTLFNEFAIQNNIKQARLGFDASRMEIQQMKDFIAMNVILEYLQVLTNKDLMVASLAGKDGSERRNRGIEETGEQLEGLNRCIWDESAVCGCLGSLNILRKAAFLLW